MNYNDDLRIYSAFSNNDIKEALRSGAIFIAPFNENQLQPSGYNLTPTYFVYSTKKKKLLPVVKERNRTYVMVDKNDTVLIRTRESIAVSSNITGEFNSKLRNTAVGFGHISTTLDPGWEGQLLIPYNNPTNKKLEFVIEEKACGKTIYNSFVTLTFHHMNSAATKSSDNKSGRWDLLDETVYSNNSLLKRSKVGILEEIVDDLKKKDSNGLEYCIKKCLDDSDKKEYSLLEDEYNLSDAQFVEEKKELFTYFMKKHIRKVRDEYQNQTEKSIEMVNKYIETKQRFLPLRYRIFNFIGKHCAKIITLVVFILLVSIWMLLNGKNNEDVLRGWEAVIASACIYILAPVLVELFKILFLNKRERK